jgi:hypothetical protein
MEIVKKSKTPFPISVALCSHVVPSTAGCSQVRNRTGGENKRFFDKNSGIELLKPS